MRPEESLVRGNALLLPVDLNTEAERGDETYEDLPLHPIKVRPAIIWQAVERDLGWIVDIVPLSSSRSHHGWCVAVDSLPGINHASTYTMDRIVRLHPSLTRLVRVVGRVRPGVLDALAELLLHGHLEDLTEATGHRAPSNRHITGWSTPSHLYEQAKLRHDGHTRRSHRRGSRRRQTGDVPRPQNVLPADDALRAVRTQRSRMRST